MSELQILINKTINTLFGMRMDPRIPDDTREFLLPLIEQLENAFSEEGVSESCEWKGEWFDGRTPYFETDCENQHWSDVHVDEPENDFFKPEGFKFCPYCRKPLVIKDDRS